MHQENSKQDNSKRYERRYWQEGRFAAGDHRVRYKKDEDKVVDWHPMRVHPDREFDGFRCRPSFRAGRRRLDAHMPLQGMRRRAFHAHRYDTGAIFEDFRHPQVRQEERFRGVAREDVHQHMHADTGILIRERKFLRRRILRLKRRLHRVNQQLY